ncbi:MAG TPA: amidohydrolase family protein [Thermoanaerobaculia bacterium]|nr:amidohydrolase family protein [Thermoanaerobaculia bacterium]
MRRVAAMACALLCGSATGLRADSPREAQPAPTLLIVNARLIDGTGAPARPGSLRISAEIAPADGLLLGRYLPNPAYAGRTVADIAKERGEAPETTLLALIRDAEAHRRQGKEGVESVIGTSMVESDLEKLLAWPHTNLCTDGELDGRHPRGFGAYPRVLGHYVRERGVLRLEEAVRKMTSLAADHSGLADRGRLVPGAYADLVLFDPAAVTDRATTSDPHALATGIERVWVNGRTVFASGSASGLRPGRVLRRGGKPGDGPKSLGSAR